WFCCERRDAPAPKIDARPEVSGLGFLRKASCGLASTAGLSRRRRRHRRPAPSAGVLARAAASEFFGSHVAPYPPRGGGAGARVPHAGLVVVQHPGRRQARAGPETTCLASSPRSQTTRPGCDSASSRGARRSLRRARLRRRGPPEPRALQVRGASRHSPAAGAAIVGQDGWRRLPCRRQQRRPLRVREPSGGIGREVWRFAGRQGVAEHKISHGPAGLQGTHRRGDRPQHQAEG
ncbi:unnamed protein product, partial [Prorocentrum cordatum]